MCLVIFLVRWTESSVEEALLLDEASNEDTERASCDTTVRSVMFFEKRSWERFSATDDFAIWRTMSENTKPWSHRVSMDLAVSISPTNYQWRECIHARHKANVGTSE